MVSFFGMLPTTGVKRSHMWQRCFSFHVTTHCCCCSCLVAKLCPILCDPMNCSMPVFPVLHNLHWVDDTIQPSHLLSPPSPPALNLSQHQGLFQWVSSSHQVASISELQASILLSTLPLYPYYYQTLPLPSSAPLPPPSPQFQDSSPSLSFHFFLPSFYYCRSHWASTKLCLHKRSPLFLI